MEWATADLSHDTMDCIVTQGWRGWARRAAGAMSRPPDPGPIRLADPKRSPGRKTIYTISIYYTVLGLSLTCSFSELYLYL